MLAKIDYRIKLLCAIVAPIVFFLVQSYFAVTSILAERDTLSQMLVNIEYMNAASLFLREVQLERGSSGLALAGGISRANLGPLRAKTDAAAAMMMAAAEKARIGSDLTSRNQDAISGLYAARQVFDNNTAAAPEVVGRYTEVVRATLKLAGMAADARTSRGLGKRMTSLTIVEEARESAGLLRANLSRVLTDPEAADAEAHLTIARVLYSTEANLGSPAITLSAPSMEILADARSGGLWKAISAIATSVLSGSNDRHDSKEVFDLCTQYVDLIGAIIAKEQDALTKQATSFIASGNRQIGTNVLTLSLAILFSVALGGYVVHYMNGSLARLTDVADELQKGKVVKPLPVMGNDAIAKLATAFNAMSEEFEYNAGMIEKVAGGDWCAELRLASSDDLLAIAMNRLIAQVNKALSAVRASVNEVSSGSNQISDASQSLSQGATESAASLEEISASATEIGQQAKSNAETASHANQLAATAKLAAEAGSNRMKTLNSSMSAITESSNQIAKIIKTIDDIAFQTNILALNAAVEAARAGRHGKGFAVVAEEVRNLAARSAKAARETADLIEGSKGRVDDGNRIAKETADALNEIVAGIIKVGDLVGEMAAASNEQAQGIAQISQGLGQIDQVTQQNTATAEQTAASAEELSGQAEALRNLIAQFKLKDAQKRPSSPAPAPRALPGKPPRAIPKPLPPSTQPGGWDSMAGRPPPAKPVSNEEIISLEDKEFGRY